MIDAPIVTPDFSYPTVDEGVTTVVAEIDRTAEAYGTPVAVIGHSLGGVVASLAVRDLPQAIASHLVVIASPYGNRVGRAFGPLMRLRLALGLVGNTEMRRRFFGRRVPDSLQREVFAAASAESRELRALARASRWFHTGAFPAGAGRPTLVVASEADRVVHVRETLEFGEELGAERHLFPRSDGVGHDDFGVWPPAAQPTATAIARFLNGNGATDP